MIFRIRRLKEHLDTVQLGNDGLQLEKVGTSGTERMLYTRPQPATPPARPERITLFARNSYAGGPSCVVYESKSTTSPSRSGWFGSEFGSIIFIQNKFVLERSEIGALYTKSAPQKACLLPLGTNSAIPTILPLCPPRNNPHQTIMPLEPLLTRPLTVMLPDAFSIFMPHVPKRWTRKMWKIGRMVQIPS
jgi:hypothetical protein